MMRSNVEVKFANRTMRRSCRAPLSSRSERQRKAPSVSWE